ncbi:hypothetical protein B9Z55_007210 [Caenorhabditis nigoni]|uniref:Uncharacterized protein n=1 Tax=Caenorhabditis nigoni TaxID=1611254 RepID=A0A2G5V8J6_9PELO|nr:hypothetical protein B9Z55_007210 [Caenorhabditis nigoni]
MDQREYDQQRFFAQQFLLAVVERTAREQTSVKIQQELATRFQEQALEKLDAIRDKLIEIQNSGEVGNQRRLDAILAPVLYDLHFQDINAVSNMIMRVQETRLMTVIPIEAVHPARLAQFQEERAAMFTVVERVEKDAQEFLEQEKQSENEDEAMDEEED